MSSISTIATPALSASLLTRNTLTKNLPYMLTLVHLDYVMEEENEYFMLLDRKGVNSVSNDIPAASSKSFDGLGTLDGLGSMLDGEYSSRDQPVSSSSSSSSSC